MRHPNAVRRSVALSIVLFILFPSALAVSAAGVAWESATPIVWSLFRCAPPPNAERLSEAAAIFMEIDWSASYSITVGTGRATGRVTGVRVQNGMDPTRSWVVPGKESPAVLAHEQCHFDLNEVYRRKLESSLVCVTATGRDADEAKSALETELHATADRILSMLSTMQSSYDDETAHGTNAAQQARWEALVAEWLQTPQDAP